MPKTINLDDPIDLPTKSGYDMAMSISGLTVVISWDSDGDLEFHELRVDGRPFPYRGDVQDAFEVALAARILKALEVEYKKHPEYYEEYLAEIGEPSPAWTSEVP